MKPGKRPIVICASKAKELTYQRYDVVVLTFRRMAARNPFEFDSTGYRFDVLSEFVGCSERVFLAGDE